MAELVAWISLGVSLSVGAFTIWHYRRTHVPHLTVRARQVSFFRSKDDDEGPSDGAMGTTLQIRVVNTGTRPVEVSQAHTQIKGRGVIWLRHAHGWINLKLAPGESKEWLENLEPHFRKVKRDEPDRSLNFPIRAVATTSDNRTFCSRFIRVQHPAGPLNLWRLRLENQWRRVLAPFRRKPTVLN